MQIEVIKASIEQKPMLANLLELYTYDFTEFLDFDVGADGLYGYEYLNQYWTEVNRFPFLIYVDKKIAGFILLQKGSPISDNTKIWDMSEFFVLKKFKRHGVGTAAALTIWKKFKGTWQVRVLARNQIAVTFWQNAIKTFTGRIPEKIEKMIQGESRIIYTFKS